MDPSLTAVTNIVSEGRIGKSFNGATFIDYSINVLVSGYINQICRYLIIISNDIIKLISTRIITANKPPLKINIHDGSESSNKLLLSINREIAWFTNIHFHVSFMTNLDENYCQLINQEDEKNLKEVLLFLLDRRNVEMITSKSNNLCGSNLFPTVIDYPQNVWKVIYQVFLMDHGDNIIATTDWRSHKKDRAIHENNVANHAALNSPIIFPSVPSLGNHQQHQMQPICIEPQQQYNKHSTKKTQEIYLQINHGDRARQIWMNSCWPNDHKIARLQDLYGDLMQQFRGITQCTQTQPTLQQIEMFCLKNGGGYTEQFNSMDVSIYINKFDQFFVWFESMCYIIRDLQHIYDETGDPLICLFYCRKATEEALQHETVGTFTLRLASAAGGLGITYKSQDGQIKHILLTWIGYQIYRIGQSDKKINLFQFIQCWHELKYLYTPKFKHIRKNLIF